MSNKNMNLSKKPEKKFVDLLYMTPSEVRAKDLAAFLDNAGGIIVELWDELNVLELELSNQNTVDFEPLSVNFKDPSDAAFVKNRGIQTIFTINLCEDDLDTIMPLFEQIVEQFSGFICADTADFTPVYVGSSKK